MPIFPTSCSAAARRNMSTSSAGSCSSDAIIAALEPTRRVCSPVSSSRNSAANASRSKVSVCASSRSFVRSSTRSSRPVFSSRSACSRNRMLRMLRIRRRTSSMSSGFVRKSCAPATRARCLTSRVTSAVRTRTGGCDAGSREAFSCSITANPSILGMWRSRMMRSGRNPSTRSRTCSGSVVETASTYPASARIRSRRSTFGFSSSTMRIRAWRCGSSVDINRPSAPGPASGPASRSAASICHVPHYRRRGARAQRWLLRRLAARSIVADERREADPVRDTVYSRIASIVSRN